MHTPYRFSRALVLTAAALAALAPVARAATAPVGPIDPATMALQPTDFVSASIDQQGYLSGPLPSYQRSFKLALVNNSTLLLFVFSSVTVASDPTTAALAYQGAAASFESPHAAKQIAASIAAGAHSKHVTVKLGRARSLGVGDTSVMLPTLVTARIKRHNLKFAVDIALVRQDLAVGVIVSLSLPKTRVGGAIAQLAGDLVAHMRVGLTPHNTAPPTLSGSLTEGSTLTIAPGTWTPSPTGYTFQWSRCDSSGNNCVPITGATGQSYTTTAADVGSTLKATVAATDVDGTAAAVASGLSGTVVS